MCFAFRPRDTQLYEDIRATQWPIIYSPEYNIGFLGLEKLHPFDAGKWGNIYNFLKGVVCSDITNILVGISGETGPVARISCFI